MANLVLNADFRLTDASERQILRQVALQNNTYRPFAGAFKFISDLAREVNASIQDVEQRYPTIRGRYL